MAQIFTYTIDADDRIMSVSKNWCDFARANNATDQCTKPFILGKTLWDFISDLETRHIYQLLLEQVRSTHKETMISINCDSPDLKRIIEITISPHGDDSIQFSSIIVEIEEREILKILDHDVERSDDIVKICSFCKKIAVSEKSWKEAHTAIQQLGLFDQRPMPMLSHGICPECYEIVMAKMNKD